MKTIPIVVTLMLAACASVPRAQVVDAKDMYVFIDGAKEPDRLPEYLVWQNGLRLLAQINDHNMKAAQESLPLSAADVALVYKEAHAEVTRMNQCQAEQKKRADEMLAAKLPIPALLAAAKEIVLDCRVKTLEAVDKLLAALSPEGEPILTSWIEARRHSISATVVKTDMDFFRQPR